MRKALVVVLALAAAASVAIVVAIRVGAGASPGPCAEPAPAGRFTASRLQAADGNCLQVYAWAPNAAPVNGVIVLVHGLHDHARRYEPLALALNDAGVAVYAYDQRGHGVSGGAEQRLDSIEQLTGDVERVLRMAAERHPGAPVFVYGHSMGGLIAAHVAARPPLPLRGAVVSSAALKLPAGASGVQLRVAAGLSAVAPGLGLQTFDDATFVRDPAAQAALAADPEISHHKLPARSVVTVVEGIRDIQRRMDSITTPLLILHGTEDQVTEVDGSRELATRAGSTDKTLRLYDGMLHDLLHEPVAAEVTREIVGFVSSRLQPAP